MPGAVLESTSLRVIMNTFFRHDEFWDGGLPFEREVEVWSTLMFRGARWLTFVFRRGYFRFEQADYASYEVEGADGKPAPFQLPGALESLSAWSLMPRVRINNALSVNGQLFVREVPIFDEARRGYEVRISPDVQYRPTTQLQVQLNYTYSNIVRREVETVTLARPSTGAVNGAGTVLRPAKLTRDTPFSSVHIPRVRVQYQFSKALFARAVAQYELARQAELTDPTTGRPLLVAGARVGARSTGAFQGEFLVQFEPSPGTTFYIGYSRLMRGRRTLSLERLDPVQEGLFLKLSYLFRM
mgnify:CR=1 FL=1